MYDQLVDSLISSVLAEDYAALVPVAIAIILNLLLRRRERKDDKELSRLQRRCVKLECENEFLRREIKRLEDDR